MTAQALPLTAQLDQTTASVRKARQGLSIYFPVLIIVSGILEWLIVRDGNQIQAHPSLIFWLMWTPAISSFVARAALREGIRDVSFRLGSLGVRGIGAAVLMPLVVGFVAYGIAWSTGLVGFSAMAPSPRALSIVPGMAWAAGLGPVPRFLALVVLFSTVVAVLGCISAAGEEIGWRGYMLTRLVKAGVPQPLFVSGLIWSVWHFPLILSGIYAAGPSPITSAGLFLIDVMGIALVIGVLRLRSGSVWPAVVLHGAWNAIIQGPFDQSSVGPGAKIWVGESGIIVAIVSLTVGLIVYQWWKRDGSKSIVL